MANSRRGMSHVTAIGTDYRTEELRQLIWGACFAALVNEADVSCENAGEIASAAAVAAEDVVREIRGEGSPGFRREAQWVPGIFPVAKVFGNHRSLR